MSRFTLYGLVLATGVGIALAGCGSDDEPGGSTAGAAGKAGGSTAGGSGEGGEAGSSAGPTLYERLGGHEGIKTEIGKIVLAELANEDIASFFAPNGVPSHKPQPTDIIECLTAQLGTAAGGPGEVYPTKTSSGFQCRSMAAAHADLHIGSGTFDEFVTIAAGVLEADGVAADDITVIGGVLTGTKNDIVDFDAPANGPCIVDACTVTGEGGAGGESGVEAGAGGALP